MQKKVPSGKLFDQLAGWCFIPAVGTFMRTSVLKELKFDETLMVEDWDMWLQMARKYQIKGIVPAMGRYRIHSASLYQQKVLLTGIMSCVHWKNIWALVKQPMKKSTTLFTNKAYCCTCTMETVPSIGCGNGS